MSKKNGKIHLDKKSVEDALDAHKNYVLGLIDNPEFRDIWKMFGGDTKFLDEKKNEVKDWKVK